MDEEISRSIEAFLSRKVYDSFDLVALASIPDEDLDQVLLDYVLLKIGEDFNRELETLKGLSSGFRAIYTTMVLEGEVNNGGFNQYFWNSKGRLAELTVAGFCEIGAPDFAKLMERAIVTWRGESSLLGRLKAIDTAEAFSESYKHTKLAPLDEEFYELCKTTDLRRRRITYVRQRPHEFVTENPDG